MIRFIWIVAALCMLLPISAEARTHHWHHYRHGHSQHYFQGQQHFQFAPPSFPGTTIGRPMRYIAGRLVCAVNVGAALAERGIRGTGSALAKSYLSWGHASGPVPGAVAVTSRRGGGHVAIVSRVTNGHVFVWNATGGINGWHEIEYSNRGAIYRVAG